MGKTIKVDQDACIGCGACMNVAGDYFDFNADGKSSPIKPYDEADKETIEEAVEGCPVGAITIEES